jgi:hypothetical protein
MTAQVLRLVDTYVEPTDDQWDARFQADALMRRDRIENGNLTIAQLIDEQDDGMAAAFEYFLGLTPERQQRCATQFKEGLARIKAAKERYRALARQELLRRGWSDD